MKTTIKILNELETISGSNAKLDILEVNKNNELLKKVFIAALDPYTTYYVSKFKMPKALTQEIQDDDFVLEYFVSTLLESLSSRKITGNAAKERVVSYFSKLSIDQQKWCQRILLRNLRVGVQEGILNKVWPGLVKSFSVALAATLKSSFQKGVGISINETVSYPVRCEPKLDGLRLIAVKKNGVVTLYTRNGTILETLPTIKKALEQGDYDNFVLDGEALAKSGTWNDSVSIVMSHKTLKNDDDIVFNVFDAIELNQWIQKKCTVTYDDRCADVHNIVNVFVNDCHIVQVPHIVANDLNELLSFFKKCMDEGFEGIMLKRTDSVYEFKRSSNILKLKPCVTYEGIIVGYYEGRKGTKNEGLFGGFELLLSNNVITRVGSGFNDDVRSQTQLNGLESYIGKIVEIEAQPDPLTNDGLSVDGKARFPVFCRFRDEADIDVSLVELGKNYLEKK